MAVEVLLANDKSLDQNPSRLPLGNITLQEEIKLAPAPCSLGGQLAIHPRMANSNCLSYLSHAGPRGRALQRLPHRGERSPRHCGHSFATFKSDRYVCFLGGGSSPRRFEEPRGS